jgi:acetyl esterase/lipase
VIKDITYSKAVNYKGENISLRFDAYQQRNGAGESNRPVAILVHGGGFSGGDKAYTPAQGNFYPDLATAFASHGYVAFSLNYRLWPDCPDDSFHIALDHTVSDVLKAVEWIKRNYEQYKIDTTKIIICGDSAGGGIAVNTSYCHVGLFAGCVDMWGGLRPYGIQNPPKVNRCPVNLETPPTCIIHGTYDSVVPCSVSQTLSAELTAAGVYNELHLLEGEKHYPVKNADRLFEIILRFSDKVLSGLSYENGNDN